MSNNVDDFKYECEQCTEKFIYKEQLNLHRNRHNDVYYECPDCRKRFLVKSNFTKHLQSHSGKSLDKRKQRKKNYLIIFYINMHNKFIC